MNNNTDDTTKLPRKEANSGSNRKSFNQTLLGQLLIESGSAALVGLGSALQNTFSVYGVDGKPRIRD